MHVLAFTALAIVGGAIAVGADLYMPDKGYRIPDSVPVLGGITLEPGVIGAIGAAIVGTIIPPIGGLLIPLAAGMAVFEGSKLAGQRLIPLPKGGGANPPALPATVGGYDPMGSPRLGYDDVTGDEIEAALAAYAA